MSLCLLFSFFFLGACRAFLSVLSSSSILALFFFFFFFSFFLFFIRIVVFFHTRSFFFSFFHPFCRLLPYSLSHSLTLAHTRSLLCHCHPLSLARLLNRACSFLFLSLSLSLSLYALLCALSHARRHGCRWALTRMHVPYTH